MTIYLYEKDSGSFLWQVSGEDNAVMLNVSDGMGFTLEPYPLDGSRYKWDGSQWVKAETEQ